MVNFSNTVILLAIGASRCKNVQHLSGGSQPHHQKLGHLQDAQSGSSGQATFDQGTEAARVRYFMHEQARQREILTAAGYAPAQSGSRYYVDSTNDSYLLRLVQACFVAMVVVFLISLAMVFTYRKCLMGDRDPSAAPPNKTLIRFQNNNLPPGTKVEKNDEM